MEAIENFNVITVEFVELILEHVINRGVKLNLQVLVQDILMS